MNKMMVMILLLALGCIVVPSAQAANILSDPGFEDMVVTGYWKPATFDESTGWFRFAWGGDVTNTWVTDGGGNNDFSYSVHPNHPELNPDDQAMKNRWANTGLGQIVDGIVVGQTYTFSLDCYHATTHPSKVDLEIRVVWHDAEDTWLPPEGGGDAAIEVAHYYPADNPLDTWVTISGDMVAPATATSVRFIVLSTNDKGDGNGGYTYYDNAVVDGPRVRAYDPQPQDGEALLGVLPTEVMWGVEVPTGDSFDYDVYWSIDDPNVLNFTKIGSGSGTGPSVDLTQVVTTEMDHDYYWYVDVNDVTIGGFSSGTVWTFDTFNPPSASIDNQPLSQNLWQDGGGTASLFVEASASGKAGTTATWISTPSAGVTFDPPTSTLADPNVTVNFATVAVPTTYELMVSADDGSADANDVIYVNVIPNGYDGLTALYEFESDAADSIGGHDGTLVGGALVDTVDAKVGSGSLLCSTLDDYVEVLDSGVADPNWAAEPGAPDEVVAKWADFTITNQFTVSAWVKAEEWTTSWQQIVTKDDGWALQRNGADPTSVSMFRVGRGTDTDPRGEVTARDTDEIQITLTDGNWHQLVGTFDGLAVRLYVDGFLEGIVENSSYLNSLPLGGGYLQIGDRGIMRIDQVRLHDIALTDSMVWDQFVADGGTNSCRQQYLATDLNEDCSTDLKDFALIAADWLLCSDQTDPSCSVVIPLP